jgi:hypothetical protein
MASTRNKNTKLDYQLEKRNNQLQYEYQTSLQGELPYHYSGNGLIHGKVPSTKLSHNSVDIESKLFGIDSNHLENEKPIVQPQLRSCINTLHMFAKSKIIMPDPLVIEKRQRPTLH